MKTRLHRRIAFVVEHLVTVEGREIFAVSRSERADVSRRRTITTMTRDEADFTVRAAGKHLGPIAEALAELLAGGAPNSDAPEVLQ